jgi:hypothetical protein
MGIEKMSHRPFAAFASLLVLCSGTWLLDARGKSGLSFTSNAERASPPGAVYPRPFVLGGRPFSPTSSWNTAIPATATYSRLHWPAGARFGIAWSSYSPAIFVASNSDPLVFVSHPAAWGYPAGTQQLQVPREADGARGTDGELLVIADGVVHNFWQFKRLDANTATAKSYGAANLTMGTGWGRTNPFLGAGIVAAGSSQLAGLLVQAETDRGEIAHALQLCVEERLAIPGYTGEAISGDGRGIAGIVQEGERLAIPPNSDMPAGLSPLGEKVFRAYQRYGVFVIDVAGGVTNLRAQANAYDRVTMEVLRHDLMKLTPMLQRVEK